MCKHNVGLEKIVRQNVGEKLNSILGFDETTSCHQTRACCCCDRLVHLCDRECISLDSLEKKEWCRPTLDMKSDIIDYYKYKGKHLNQNPNIGGLLLSPRSFAYEHKNRLHFDICRDCNLSSRKIPDLSIHALQIGKAPEELACLNEVELALVSQGRIDRHIFQCFAGQHKQITMWHQMFFSDVEHTWAAFERMDELKIPDKITCVLSGPFTTKQKEEVLKRFTIDRKKIVRALEWLKENNVLYENVRLPEEIEMPTPIDHSVIVEGMSTQIETVFETTIIFPQLNEIDSDHTGYDHKEECLRDVLKDKRLFEMVHKPTPSSMKGLDGDNLVGCFPLQFPYGHGKRPKNVDLATHIRHLSNISEPVFQKAEMLLPLLVVLSKNSMVQQASTRCNYKVGGDKTMKDVVNNIDLLDVDLELYKIGKKNQQPNARGKWNSTDVGKLLQHVAAVSKKLPFSDEAAKEARKHLFSLCTMFGLPSMFLTVTPDDTESFIVRIHSVSKLMITDIDNEDDVEEHLAECASARINFPGLCEHNFEAIASMVIEDIIGWDMSEGSSKDGGGVFGKCNAWFTPIEEQRKNTLHNHFLLWLQGWDDLVSRIYSVDKKVSDDARKEMQDFIDHAISTKCFALSSGGHCYNDTFRDYVVRKHKQEGCKNPQLIACTPQQLRNMRCHFCSRTEQSQAILSCEGCNKTFSTDDFIEALCEHVEEVTTLKIKEEKDLDRLRAIISARLVGVDLGFGKVLDQEEFVEFIVALLKNRHFQEHTNTCFKKGDEGRCMLPKEACDSTKVHVYKDETIDWCDWNGEKQPRHPYFVEPRRDSSDVFMNQHSPLISDLFCCNTNVQCGIDGAHMMCCTCYATKANKKEEKQSMIDACNGLLSSLKKEMREKQNLNEADPPDVTAFRRLFSAIMASAENYTVGGPLAKFLINHDSRFMCSHTFVPVPFRDLKSGTSTLANLHVLRKNKAFLSSSRDAHLFRHDSLEDLCPHQFFSEHQVIKLNKHNRENDDVLLFRRDAPKVCKNLALKRRSVAAVPIIYHDMMECNTKDLGGNMFDDSNINDGDREVIESYCKKILLLFWHYREDSNHTVNGSFRSKLIATMNDDDIHDEFGSFLQNMQNCRNSLRCGRVQSPLDKKTTEPLPPESDKKRKRSTRRKSWIF